MTQHNTSCNGDHTWGKCDHDDCDYIPYLERGTGFDATPGLRYTRAEFDRLRSAKNQIAQMHVDRIKECERLEDEIQRLSDSLWDCGDGHRVWIASDVPPFELPTCPWCEVADLQQKLNAAIDEAEEQGVVLGVNRAVP